MMMHQDVLRTLAEKLSMTPSQRHSMSRSSVSNPRRKSLSMPTFLFQPTTGNNNQNEISSDICNDDSSSINFDQAGSIQSDNGLLNQSASLLNRSPFINLNGNRSPESDNMITHRRKRNTSKRLKVDNREVEGFISPIGVENGVNSSSIQLLSHSPNIPIGDIDNIDAMDRIEKISFEPILYPQDIPILPPGLLKALYDDILKSEDDSLKGSESSTVDIVAQYDQIYLNDAGIVSFEKVLLPAIAYLEEEGLKKLQAKIQRDQPELKPTILQCRKFVYTSIGKAVIAAETSRLERTQINRTREDGWAKEKDMQKAEAKRIRLEEKERRKVERKQLREIQRLKKVRELKKKHPPNLETWKEVAFLISELSQLQKDETKLDLGLREVHQRMQDLAVKETSGERDENEMTENNSYTCSSPVDIRPVDKTAIEIAVIAQTFQDIIISTTRIDNGMKVVTDVVEKSEKVRKEVYNEYTQNHQFQGYQGIHNPKGLILALSQSQPDSDWDF